VVVVVLLFFMLTYNPYLKCVRVNPMHQLFALGCENGNVECIDPRSKTYAGILPACAAIKAFTHE